MNRPSGQSNTLKPLLIQPRNSKYKIDANLKIKAFDNRLDQLSPKKISIVSIDPRATEANKSTFSRNIQSIVSRHIPKVSLDLKSPKIENFSLFQKSTEIQKNTVLPDNLDIIESERIRTKSTTRTINITPFWEHNHLHALSKDKPNQVLPPLDTPPSGIIREVRNIKPSFEAYSKQSLSARSNPILILSTPNIPIIHQIPSKSSLHRPQRIYRMESTYLKKNRSLNALNNLKITNSKFNLASERIITE